MLDWATVIGLGSSHAESVGLKVINITSTEILVIRLCKNTMGELFSPDRGLRKIWFDPNLGVLTRMVNNSNRNSPQLTTQ